MTTENIKIQDYGPQRVLDPLWEAEKASKRSATAQAVAPAVTTFLAVEDGTAGAPNHTQLVQRLETLEAIASRLEQRLSALEQGQLYRLSPPVKTASNPHSIVTQLAQPQRQNQTFGWDFCGVSNYSGSITAKRSGGRQLGTKH